MEVAELKMLTIFVSDKNGQDQELVGLHQRDNVV